MTDQSDHVVLPRAAAEELRDKWIKSAKTSRADAEAGIHDTVLWHRETVRAAAYEEAEKNLRALLAAAKGVESLGRHEALTDSGALPDEPQFYVDPSVPLSGFYEIFIAADAAEEG